MKYIVMECHPAFAVVLDEEGRFLKVANFRYQVGETVTDVVELQLPETEKVDLWKKRRSRKRWGAVLGALAACLMLTVGLVWQMSRTTYGSVYLRINPEVRVDVNRWEQVLAVTGTNADGAKLLEGFEPEGSLEEVLVQLTDRAEEEGYLKEGGKVALALDAENYDWVVTHGEALRAALDDHVDDSVRVVLGPDWVHGDTEEVPVQPPVAEDEDDEEDNDFDDRDDEDDDLDDEDDSDDDEDDFDDDDDDEDDEDECGEDHHHGGNCGWD